MMRRFFLSRLAPVLLGLGTLLGSTQAASLQISPTSLRFDLAQPRAGSLSLSNPSSEAVTISVTLLSWTQQGGQERLEPSTDLLVNPARFVIPANGEQIVRVGWRGKGFPTSEKAYRMEFQSVPADAPPGDERLKVRVVLNMSVPIVFLAPGAQPKLSWAVTRQGDDLAVQVQNVGGRFISFRNPVVSGGGFEAGLKSFAILAGGDLRFTVPGGAKAVGSLSLAFDGAEAGSRDTLALPQP